MQELDALVTDLTREVTSLRTDHAALTEELSALRTIEAELRRESASKQGELDIIRAELEQNKGSPNDELGMM
jgi:chromosome segregation ATPase